MISKSTLKGEMLLRTFLIRSGSIVSFKCPDFVSYFLQLLLDFLTVWSGIKAVVVVIHITVSFVRLGTGRGFHRRVCKCRYEISEQNSSEKVFHHAMIFENFTHKENQKISMTSDCQDLGPFQTSCYCRAMA